MDDATVGRALRALRLHKGWRQEDLAVAAGVSQSVVSRAERNGVDRLTLSTTRSLFAAVDAGCNLAPWWRSGQLDRLLDEDHALLVSRAVEFLQRYDWTVEVEASFAVYGERGSIDLLATRRADGAVLVVEVKTRLMSVEELLRTLDRKVRLASRIVDERHGWRPRIIGRLVVFADDTTNRTRVRRATVLDTALPLRSRALAAWLEAPSRSDGGAGAVFLPLSRGTTGKRRVAARQRVRRPKSCTNEPNPRQLAGPQRTYQSLGD